MNFSRGFRKITFDWPLDLLDEVDVARGVTPEKKGGDVSRWQWVLSAIRVKLAEGGKR